MNQAYDGDHLLTPTTPSLPPMENVPPTNTGKIDYLSIIEHFLLHASDQDFQLYVQHCRMLLSHPEYQEHRERPKLFLGIPTGPNTNQLFATGDRWFVLAAVKQVRCDAETEREQVRKGGERNGEGLEGEGEKRYPGGNGGKCEVM